MSVFRKSKHQYTFTMRQTLGSSPPTNTTKSIFDPNYSQEQRTILPLVWQCCQKPHLASPLDQKFSEI